jgi:TonB family protein
LVALSRSSRPPISAAPPPTPVPVKQQPARTPAPEVRAPAPRAETPSAATRPRAAAAPSASELDAVARLRSRGALLEPPGANAYEQLLALHAKYPDSIEVRTEQQQLASAFLDRTRTALAAGDVDTARAFLSRVDTLVPNLPATKSLQTQLASAQQERNFATNIVQAKTLKLVREVPPSYPREAERQGLSGWVDVEFTVAPNGTTQDVVVRGAQPLRTFDQSAIDAVKRWRFEPVMRNGAPVPQRAAVRIRFQLK